MIDFDHQAGDPNPILTIGGMTLRAQCLILPPSVMDFTIVSSTNADVSWGWLDEMNYAGARPFTDSIKLFPGTPEGLVQISANAGTASTHRAEGQLVYHYHDANRIITVTFHAAARYDSANAMNNRCQVRGTAIAAPG